MAAISYPTHPSSGDTGALAYMATVADKLESIVGAKGLWHVGLDSFQNSAGTLTDDQLLTAAMSYAAGQSNIPAIMFPRRGDLAFSQTGRVPYTGMKFVGPGGSTGPKNLEQSAGKPVSHRVMLTVGTGASAWFNGTGTYFDIYIGDLAFQYSGVGQFWNQPSGSLYACQFHSLTHYGATGVFGNASTKALITQVLFTGHWTVLGFPSNSTQFHLGGSDSQLWRAGYLNIQPPSSSTGAGNPCIWYDSLGKTSVGYIYNTADKDFAGTKITGSPGNSDITIFGGTYEGIGAASPATRPLLDVQGGVVNVFGTDFNQVATANGAITQSGGILNLYSPNYLRSSTVTASYPLLYQTGGVAAVYSPNCRTSGEDCTVRWSDGTTTTVSRANQVTLQMPAISNLVPASATASDCATAINTLLAELRTSKLLAP